MTREELIAHLEHLAEYVKYSEDAPALREAIALLKTHEERTETHVCDLIQPDHNAEVSKKVGDDLIRRHGVSAWLYNLGYPKLADIVMNEQRFPPAQPEQRWISCSERLPKKHGESYLVTISDGAVYTTALQWDANGKRWYLSFFNDGNILVDFIDDVIAWMPLPEPYQAERREE